MFEYPYGDLQKLNLDWLLQAWREFQHQIEDAIAPQWSDTTSYTEDDVVFHDHVLYICTVPASTVRIFKADEWEVTQLIDIVNGG